MKKNILINSLIVASALVFLGGCTKKDDTQNNNQSVNTDNQVLKPFVESDFYWDKDTEPYKKLLLEQVNRIRESNPECRDMEPDVSKSQSKGTKSDPVFFVMCGKDNSVHNVFFSKSEAESKTVSTALKALDEATAVQKCIDKIKRNATNPESVDAHYLLGKAYTAHPNGNATVILNFDAKNGFGAEMGNQARCVVQPNGETDIWFEKN